MSDRFRFRVWGKEEKKFVELKHDGTYCLNASSDILFIDFNGVVDCLSKHDYPVQQCTGLKDKHGKLIYEGDIVKYGDRIGKIYWQSNFYCSCFTGAEWDGIADDMEIVGNIFESPKLLENNNEA